MAKSDKDYTINLGWHKKDGRVIIVYQVTIPGIQRTFYDPENMHDFLMGYAAADMKDSKE